MNRLVTWRYEFTIIAARFLDENSAWPHLWPSTASDYVETVLTRASESIVFGLKSTKKSTKVVKKRWRICSGRRSRKFESCHLDQKTAENKLFLLVFGCFSIYFSQNRMFSVDHMFAWFFDFLLDFSWLFLNPFENPFSLLAAMQFLRADRLDQSSFLSSSRQIGICLIVKSIWI